MMKHASMIALVVLSMAGASFATVYDASMANVTVTGNVGDTWNEADNQWGSGSGWVWNGSNGPAVPFLIQRFDEAVPANDATISIAGVASGTYDVGVYWFSHNSTTQTVTLQVTIEGSSVTGQATGDAGTFGWMTLGTATVSDGTMTISLGDATSSDPGGYWFSLGQVSLTAVPEPVTLGLLAVGGLFGLRRNR